jgi:drug/metabolite transporter (DMT)-like permease
LYQIKKKQDKTTIKAQNQLKWALFVFLCLIWGSSFVLMKLGMFGADGSALLSPLQVAAIRILSAGIVLIPFIPKAIQRIPPSMRLYVAWSGWLGSAIPAVLFCLAESKIDSALAGSLNALTPLSTLAIAWLFYSYKIAGPKFWGILIGLAGCLLLFTGKAGTAQWQYPGFAFLVVMATICYGWNVNMVKRRMAGLAALDIATFAFAGLIPFALLLLWISGFFALPFYETAYLQASGAAILLGVVGTALASVIFYRLVRLSGIVFSSMVTYGIPFVAIGWGVIYGEQITWVSMFSLLVILLGVYLANRSSPQQ